MTVHCTATGNDSGIQGGWLALSNTANLGIPNSNGGVIGSGYDMGRKVGDAPREALQPRHQAGCYPRWQPWYCNAANLTHFETYPILKKMLYPEGD